MTDTTTSRRRIRLISNDRDAVTGACAILDLLHVEMPAHGGAKGRAAARKQLVDAISKLADDLLDGRANHLMIDVVSQ